MMVKITKDYIKKLSSLSMIELTSKEIESFSKDIDTVISSVKTLDKFEKETGKKIITREFEEINFSELRDDITEKGISKEEVFKNAPFTEDGYFKIHGKVFEIE